MWSRRSTLGFFAGAALAAALPGCGFRPLYGNRTPGGAPTGQVSVNQQLAGVRIDPIANRLGQQVHNALRDGMNPLGQPAAATHHLSVKLTTRVYGALARSDLSATRRNVEITAFYQLFNSGGQLVLSDASQINTGYDEFDDPLNDITANEHAQERGAQQLAEMIKTRVAAYFAQTSANAAQ
jgi:LPS-assembly lipoprotein